MLSNICLNGLGEGTITRRTRISHSTVTANGHQVPGTMEVTVITGHIPESVAPLGQLTTLRRKDRISSVMVTIMNDGIKLGHGSFSHRQTTLEITGASIYPSSHEVGST